MSEKYTEEKNIIEDIAGKEYEHGFVTDLEQEFIPKGLNEDIVRLISAKKRNLSGCWISVWTLFVSGKG